MKKNLMITTATGAVLALTAPADAGNYVTVFGGWSQPKDDSVSLTWTNSGTLFSSFSASDTNIKDSWQPTMVAETSSFFLDSWVKYTREWAWTNEVINYWTTTTLDLTVDNGFVIGAAFGWELDKRECIGLELEFAYRKHDVNAIASFITGHSTSSIRAAGYGYYTLFHSGTWHYLGFELGWETLFTLPTERFTYFATKGGKTFSTGGGATLTETESGDITSWAIMANVWWDLNHAGIWHPYVGGGIGFADVALEVGPISVSDNGLAWQVGAGLGFDIDADTRLNLEYRYFTVPDLELTYMGQDLGIEYDLQEIIVGLRLRF